MLATILGLALAAWTFGVNGWRDIVGVAARMGVAGFLLVCVYSVFTFAMLGAAWVAAASEAPARLALFTWGRLVREAASDLLPFSQIGGIVIGMRTLVARGIPPARAYASFVVDLTTEMAAQLLFTIFGLALMATILVGDGADLLRPAILGGTGILAAMILAIFLGQRALLAFATRLAHRFVPGSAAAMADIETELARLYGRRRSVALALLLNLAAWVQSAAGAWLILKLVEIPFSFWAALSLESLIFTLRSVAFAIPGALGVQEVAYALAGPLFGLGPEAALALALAKRARDLTVALPTLIVWQASETRAILKGAR
ncbi:MAG TPA: lysylphosphatidylglycerol synthase domain-containing protein [Sphingomonas sp.]|nr:lysylphosphatidylglycerol synthase domain-containing protein [Sphingomonas sp.]